MMMIKWCLLLKFIWVSLLCVKKKLRISIWVFWSKLHNGPFLNLGRITNWSFTVLVNLQNGPRMFRVNYWMALLGSEFPQGMNLYCIQMNWISIIYEIWNCSPKVSDSLIPAPLEGMFIWWYYLMLKLIMLLKFHWKRVNLKYACMVVDPFYWNGWTLDVGIFVFSHTGYCWQGYSFLSWFHGWYWLVEFVCTCECSLVVYLVNENVHWDN